MSITSKKESFQYTVEQLIGILQTLPRDLPILTSGYETGFENFSPPKIVQLKHQPENAYYDGEFQIAEEKGDSTFQAVVLQRLVRNV